MAITPTNTIRGAARGKYNNTTYRRSVHDDRPSRLGLRMRFRFRRFNHPYSRFFDFTFKQKFFATSAKDAVFLRPLFREDDRYGKQRIERSGKCRSTACVWSID